MMEALAVALGGALGSLGRWGIGNAFRVALPGLPAGTFAANVLAGLIIGLVSGANAASPLQPEVKALLTVGLCGGLSTFSTFSNETFSLIESGNVAGAAANIVANVAVCLLAVWAGTRLGAVIAS
ncbi:fluoride efflux transporter CrcB [Paratractidigestivibacter sp.]|uniref:fluoride efflux transporter CrcB n=1 Tax=Paratractidigestivibacter sp. TaxID=2847316 RepID=UPI002ABE81F1|nr:fluoride efflux transporter CrcB [Paratractidigestivibacter sp.]